MGKGDPSRPRGQVAVLAMGLAMLACLFLVSRGLGAVVAAMTWAAPQTQTQTQTDLAIAATGAVALLLSVRAWAKPYGSFARDLAVTLGVGPPLLAMALGLGWGGDLLRAPLVGLAAGVTVAPITLAILATLGIGFPPTPHHLLHDHRLALAARLGIPALVMSLCLGAPMLVAVAPNASGLAAVWPAIPSPGSALPAALAIVTLLVMVAVIATAGALVTKGPAPQLVGLAPALRALAQGYPQIDPTDVELERPGQPKPLRDALRALQLRLAAERRLYHDALNRARAANADKSEFVTLVSQELGGPLRQIDQWAQGLLDQTPGPLHPGQVDDVALIQTGARQLLDLVEDILDTSMIESGELRLRFASTCLTELAREVLRIHEPLVRRDRVELRLVGSELPTVVCDRRRVGQVLANLVSNAMKFTERGFIELGLEALAERSAVAIRCRDSGVGIPAEDLARIFEPYHQAGAVARRKKGTGLGLAIARNIAMAHGGTLDVESEVGRGSSFTLVLPIEPPARPSRIDLATAAARTRARRHYAAPGAGSE